MESRAWTRTLSRRGMLKVGLFVGALPLLQACASQPTAQPPAKATPQVVTKEVTKVVPVQVTTVVEKQVQVVVTATPKPSPKVNGNVSVIQERSFNPRLTDDMHNLLITYAHEQNWPLDLSYSEGFTGGSDFYQKLAAAVTSGDSPDLFFGTQDPFQLWYLKTLQPVDDLVNWAIKQYGDPVPALKLGEFFEGHWWGVPYFVATGGYWARKSWHEAVGFDVTADHNLQDWLDEALKVSDPSKQRWGWGNTVNRSGDGETNVHDVVFQAGGRYTDESGTKVVFNSDETVAAYAWLKDLYTNPKWASALPTGVNAWTDPSNNQAWLAGTIGFTSNAGTLFATAQKDKPDIAKDTFLVSQPAGPVGKKQRLPGAPGDFRFLIFQGAKNPDPARQMTQALLSKDTLKLIWKLDSGHAVPAYKWGWDEPEIANSLNDVPKIYQKNAYDPNAWMDWLPGPSPKLWINAIGSAVVLTETMADILKGTAIKDAVATGHGKIEKLRDKFEGK